MNALRSGRRALVGFKDRGAASIPGTSEAAATATIGAAKTRRAAVLATLEQGGPQTAEELGEALDLHWFLVRPRLSELASEGLVIDTGERGAGALGGRVIRWRATSERERIRFRQDQATAEREGRRNG